MPGQHRGVCCDGRPAALRLPRDRVRAPRPRPDQTPGHARPGVAAQHLRLLHLRRRAALATALRAVRPRPAGGARHRHADQVPGGPAGVHVPGRRVAAREGPAGPRRARLRHPAGGRVHQAGRLRAPRRPCSTSARSSSSPTSSSSGSRRQDPRLVRRARGPVRPAGHGPAEHGRRLRRPLRAGRRAQLRPRRQAHPAVQGLREHLRRRGRLRHPDLEGGLRRALLGRDLRRQLRPADRRAADDRLVRRPRELLRRVRRRQGACSSTSTTTPSRCPGTTRCPGRAADLLKETRANHLGKLAFRWIYWNVLLPGRPMPLPAHMSMVGKTPPVGTTP